MSAGKISLWFNQNSGSGNIHLVYLDPGSGLPFWRLQTTLGSFGRENLISEQIVFDSIKLVQGVQSWVMLIGLDTKGGLWYSTGDDSGVWSGFNPLQNLPGQEALIFASFDAAFIFNIGVVVAAVSRTKGLTYSQSTADGITWSQPAWSNMPSASPSIITGAADNGSPVSWQPSWPPPLNPVVVGDNGSAHEGDNAPIIAGTDNAVPLVLYNDSSNTNWQWSQLPTVQKSFSYQAGTHRAFVNFNVPPYSTDINDIYFCDGQNVLGPILLLLGADGNLYFIAATNGNVAGWSYYGPGPLPNPGKLMFTKAKMALGYPVSNYLGNLQVIAMAGGLPYVLSQNAAGSVPLQGGWSAPSQLNLQTNPNTTVNDFDVLRGNGIQIVQVAYLMSDGSICLNFQQADGNWYPAAPLDRPRPVKRRHVANSD